MSQEKLNIALIGCGRIAGHHLKAIKKISKTKIIAVCDKNIEKAKYYGSKYNIPFFSNYHQMLKDIPSINVVAIMTPSGMHYEHTVNIIKKYRKNIIIEKPTFMKPREVTKAFKFAREKNVKIFPVFQNRYNKAVKRVKKAITTNELGTIRIVNIRVRWCRPDRYYKLSKWRGTYSHDGGVLTNQGIHHIDLLRFLCGEVKSLYATMKTLGANIEVEDSVVATFIFDNKAIGSLEITTAARPIDYEASISILGSKGMVQIGGLAVNELQIFSNNPSQCKKYSEKIPDAYGFGHIDFYRDVKNDLLLKNSKKFPVDKLECFKTIKLLSSFYRSAELNRKVFVNKTGFSKKLGRKNENLSKLYRTY